MKRSGVDHPKIILLSQLLHIEIWGAVGVLELVWNFTGKFAPQGDIGKYSDEQIAEAVHWRVRSGSRGVPTGVRLRSALVQAGFLDTCDCHRLVVHDWPDHADEAVRKFLSRHRLDFVHTQSLRPSLALPEPMPAASGGQPPDKSAAAEAAAAAASPASPPDPQKPNAASPPHLRELPSFLDAVQQAIHELTQEGHKFPEKTLRNEYGRHERNPAFDRFCNAIHRAEPRIRSARMPVAFARKVILDALQGA